MLKAALNFLFPISCLSCKASGTYLCDRCVKIIPRETKIFYGSRSVPSFSSPPDFKRGLFAVMAAARYQNPIIQKSIHLLKYRRIRALAKPLGDILAERVREFVNENPKQWLIVPIPLHPRKLRARGFNQNDLISQAAFEMWDSVCLKSGKFNPLRRVKDTRSQTDLKVGERFENVKGVFAVSNEVAIRGRSVILIDDVMTTGATMLLAGKTLYEAGAREIWGAVVAYD